MRKVLRKTWWVTRPSRDLRDLKEALSYFYEIAEGKKWYANRELHKKFELNNPAKTSNYGKISEGGGGRTWAAWLRMWGLWYDKHCVTLTPAGRILVEEDNPEIIYKQITHLIMRFQITNAYLESEGMEEGFQVFPFQFLIQLLLHKNIEYLTLDEIGLFVLDVKRPHRLETIVGKICEWRKKETDKLKMNLIRQYVDKYTRPRSDSPVKSTQLSKQKKIENSWRSFRDVGHVFAYNLCYIHGIVYENGRLHIQKNEIDSIINLLNRYKDTKFIYNTNYPESLFLKKFGSRYDRYKSSDKETKPISKYDKQQRRIENAVNNLKKSNKFNVPGLIFDIKKITNYDEPTIEKILSEKPHLTNNSTHDEFGQYYMECACNGDRHQEFEELTRMMFSKMGFEIHKMKTSGIKYGRQGEVDGFIINKYTGLSGILECKAGPLYSFSKGDVEKMKHVYIKYFKKKTINRTQYTLDFFIYVVGKKATSLGNFYGIVAETTVRGSIICANDLLLLYRMYEQKRINQIKIWGLFKIGKQITRSDILSICE